MWCHFREGGRKHLRVKCRATDTYSDHRVNLRISNATEKKISLQKWMDRFILGSRCGSRWVECNHRKTQPFPSSPRFYLSQIRRFIVVLYSECSLCRMRKPFHTNALYKYQSQKFLREQNMHWLPYACFVSKQRRNAYLQKVHTAKKQKCNWHESNQFMHFANNFQCTNLHTTRTQAVIQRLAYRCNAEREEEKKLESNFPFNSRHFYFHYSFSHAARRHSSYIVRGSCLRVYALAEGWRCRLRFVTVAVLIRRLLKFRESICLLFLFFFPSTRFSLCQTVVAQKGNVPSNYKRQPFCFSFAAIDDRMTDENETETRAVFIQRRPHFSKLRLVSYVSVLELMDLQFGYVLVHHSPLTIKWNYVVQFRFNFKQNSKRAKELHVIAKLMNFNGF